ncbi:phospholipid phosphatase, partial [Listeria monocytogenes]|nr:phospholipid phosphatase [Listeria monocytogenes]
SNLLIASRFPYLSSQQQLDVLTSTMMPAGVPLDDGSGWARLNLYAAAGGYGAFNNGMVTVNMNAAAGGFSAFDFWS